MRAKVRMANDRCGILRGCVNQQNSDLCPYSIDVGIELPCRGDRNAIGGCSSDEFACAYVERCFVD